MQIRYCVPAFTLNIVNDFVATRYSKVVVWARCLVTVKISLLQFTTGLRG